MLPGPRRRRAARRAAAARRRGRAARRRAVDRAGRARAAAGRGRRASSVVVTALLGLGVLLGLSPRTPAGLDEILFGDVLGVSDLDIGLAAGLGVVIVVVLAVLHPSLMAIGFDRAERARARALAGAVRRRARRCCWRGATLVAVQALGNLLVVAMLVGPAATARLLCDRMAAMMARRDARRLRRVGRGALPLLPRERRGGRVGHRRDPRALRAGAAVARRVGRCARAARAPDRPEALRPGSPRRARAGRSRAR